MRNKHFPSNEHGTFLSNDYGTFSGNEREAILSDKH